MLVPLIIGSRDPETVKWRNDIRPYCNMSNNAPGIVSCTCVAVMALIGIIPEIYILKDVRQQWYCFKAGKLPNHGNLDNIALAIRLFVFSAYTVLGIM
ncbi:hypothetical protein VKT23_018152 [Stygiomarasmius scandens]|uniref:Uncharacterized protein n=1 Tax=Marasmiellus scandens TaxID=2682957 RepID=A0ABR1ITG5_9AGAR